MKIGLFDSGLGGLTILRSVASALPNYDYVYYGDTANLPYGEKTEEEIYRLSVAAMEYLFGQGCALVVVACNTASAETLRKLQVEFLPVNYPDRKILGVIVPTIETLLESGAKSAVLLATTRTVTSKKYDRELAKREAHVALVSVATPELVPLVEAGDTEAAVASAASCVDKLREENPEIDTVILGCTHYTCLKDGLRARYGEELVVISQDEIIPHKLADYLKAHSELDGGEVSKGERLIHLTAQRPDYDHIIAQLLGGAFVSDE